MASQPPPGNRRKAWLLALFVVAVLAVWVVAANLRAGRHNGGLGDGRPPETTEPVPSR